MNILYGNIVLITGASSGIGKACAEYLMKNGFKVYGTSRHPEENSFTRDEKSGGSIEMIELDVCSDTSVNTAVNYIIEKEGAINILVNCAGYGIAGSVEDTTAEEAYNQLNANFLGTLRMCRSVLPYMRQQKKGLIVNVSSVAGFVPIPFQSMYSASKYAIEAMSEALRMEVKPFGIRVAMVEPGDTRTGFTDKREFVKASKSGSAYSGVFEVSIDTMANSEKNGHKPEKVVQAISKIINSSNPPVRITVGMEYKAVKILKNILPARLVEYILSKVYC